jgi:hypothetical protein
MLRPLREIEAELRRSEAVGLNLPVNLNFVKLRRIKMNLLRLPPIGFLSLLSLVLLSYNLPGFQDPYGKPKAKEATTAVDHAKHKDMGMAHPNLKLTAVLVDAEAKAQKKEATVKVTVTGARMTDPAIAKEKPKTGQAHLHYQVDSGPIIATTSTKLSFHELTPGVHKIMVVLSANDHSPLGPQETLTVRIP